MTNVVYDLDGIKGPRSFRTKRGIPVRISKIVGAKGKISVTASNFVGSVSLKLYLVRDGAVLLEEGWTAYSAIFPTTEQKDVFTEHIVNFNLPESIEGLLVLEMEARAYIGSLRMVIPDISAIYE
ncbi:hypothetical protein [Infirmifilum sp. NZ]|uniref:hypothetical protein n=1 Tax=Infirmifilum sp. NZ TaxID=2926850 RepID=UPI0027AB7DE5|nr:hypothetical protein [Infirmifilum sp. NZ]UNQ73392.1 hypothetical protein MOV14_09810 [Infirmifilum sp. NZ]